MGRRVGSVGYEGMIAEYWILDPQRAQVIVLALSNGVYQETIYKGDQPIISAVFPKLKLTATELLES